MTTLPSSVRETSPSHQPAHRALVAGALALSASLAGNLACWAAASALGGPLSVRMPPDGHDTVITVSSIVAATVVGVLGGTLALTACARWWRGGWRPVGWMGLFVGLATAVMPLTTPATLATRGALAAMHVITGVAWWISVQQLAQRTPRDAAEGGRE